MKYYLAVEIPEKPFIFWSLWAKNHEELVELGEEENPLVLPEDNIPDFVYGVCPLKIVSGELVQRSTIEMSGFESEYLAAQDQVSEKNKKYIIDSSTFVYASKEFPMHEAARLRYLAVGLDTGSTGDVDFMSIDGTVVTVTNSNKSLFLGQFYKKIQEVTSLSIL